MTAEGQQLTLVLKVGYSVTVVALLLGLVVAASMPEDGQIRPIGSVTIGTYFATFVVGAWLRRLVARLRAPAYREGEKGRQRLTGVIIADDQLLVSPWTDTSCVALVVRRHTGSHWRHYLRTQKFLVRRPGKTDVLIAAGAEDKVFADGPRQVLDLELPIPPQCASFYADGDDVVRLRNGVLANYAEARLKRPLYEIAFEPGMTVTIVGTFDPVPEANSDVRAVRPRASGGEFAPLCFCLGPPSKIGRLRKRDFRRWHVIVILSALFVENLLLYGGRW